MVNLHQNYVRGDAFIRPLIRLPQNLTPPALSAFREFINLVDKPE